MGDGGTLVVYLAGAREFHRPDLTLGCTGGLDEQVRAATDLPIAPPPGAVPATIADQQVQLLRLDRVAESLAGLDVPDPITFAFVLTDQLDTSFKATDTAALRPVLDRWCIERGFGSLHEVLTQAPHQLDGAGTELMDKLDDQLSRARQVVLVAGGGPAALQTAAHFSVFQGVRHRDDVTVMQLEEVRQPTSDDLSSRSHPIDTRVRNVRRFHRLVGQRTIEQHAGELLDQLDLPAAAQLVRAAHGAGLGSDRADQLAQQLLEGLSRQQPTDQPVTQLDAAISLAELEWSRPGGSRAEALWYAGLSVVDLLASAWAATHHVASSSRRDTDVVNEFNNAVKLPRRRDVWSSLQLSERGFQAASPLLAVGPPVLYLPNREVPLADVLGPLYLGGRQDQTLLWAALLVTFKRLRNEYAHEMLGLTLDGAADRLRRASGTFIDGAEYLDAAGALPWPPKADPQAPASQIRTMLQPDHDSGSGALDLTITDESPGSAFRRVIRILVPSIEPRNPMMTVARDLRVELIGQE